WYLKSINYSQYLTPLGFEIFFFNRSFTLISPLTLSALVFLITSFIIPLVWRSSKYSLYSSTLASLLGLAMIINSLIFQQRYLSFHGYSVLPTPNGAFYIFFPSEESFTFPFYLMIVSIIISILNSITRASWLPVGRLTLLERIVNDVYEKGVINALTNYFDRFGVKYALTNDRVLQVGKVMIGNDERLNVFFPSTETVVFGKKYVAYINKDGEIKYLNIDDGIKLTLAKSIEEAEIVKNEERMMYGE
ncbi:hypothetical protein DJ522_07635, partial [Sulfolobus sp. F3]